MKLICRCMLALVPAVLMLSSVGCGEPDKSQAPGFNKASATDPGSVKDMLAKPKKK